MGCEEAPIFRKVSKDLRGEFRLRVSEAEELIKVVCACVVCEEWWYLRQFAVKGKAEGSTDCLCHPNAGSPR